MSRHTDPAVSRPVVAQANLDVNGRLVRAQVQGESLRRKVRAVARRPVTEDEWPCRRAAWSSRLV